MNQKLYKLSRPLDLPEPKWTHLPLDHGLVAFLKTFSAKYKSLHNEPISYFYSKIISGIFVRNIRLDEFLQTKQTLRFCKQNLMLPFLSNQRSTQINILT